MDSYHQRCWLQINPTVIVIKPLFFGLFCVLFGNIFFAQSLDLERTLVQWDSIRGAWLMESARAISHNQVLPDRTFAEDFTPYELMSMVPMETRNALQEILFESPSSDLVSNTLMSLVEATLCSSLQGRSFGDPHTVTYDRSSYSFQTVGEFVLTKSLGRFEVQTRQKPQRDDFSLNTAVAVQLYGDRLCYYVEDVPDGSNQPLWLNGQPLQLQGRTYYLPHGGTVRVVGRNYIVAGPMGERVFLDVRGGRMGFINVTFEIPRCHNSVLTGLLGNGNGVSFDEFETSRQSNFNSMAGFIGMNAPEFAAITEDIEQRYQNQLIKGFAEVHRVKTDSSLFDYLPGLTTDFYTDRSFPRVIRTFSAIPNNSREAARNRCREQGVTEAEMNGCIFDSFYLDLSPNPIPNPPPATEGVIMERMRHPLVNTNSVMPTKNPDGNAQPKPPSSPAEINPASNAPEKETAHPKPIIHAPDLKPSQNEGGVQQPAKPVTPKPVNTKPLNQTPAPMNPVPLKPGKGKN
ncbi:MAG: hypothetical protein FJY06_05205 [Bacteroidetes bacterium]|nr:hypothetical protein [Bacteroidota bacterium]